MRSTAHVHSLDDEVQKRRVSAEDPIDAQIANLQALISNPPQNSRVIDIGPDLAQWILDEIHGANRPRKPSKIRDFAADMASKDWGLTGDTIKFGRDGLLHDGQNRMVAVIKSGAIIRTHAVFGIDPKLFVRMDIGKNRNNADTLANMGVDAAGRVAQMARWLMILTSDNPKNRALSVKNPEMQEFYKKHVQPDPDRFYHSLEIAREVNKTLKHPIGPIAALHYLFAVMSSQDDADIFMREWAMGMGRGVKAPTRKLQSKLQQIAANSAGRVHEVVRVGLICIAWVAWRNKRSLSERELHFDVQTDSYAVDFASLKP